ncbi:BON domain-containing protein [Pandoraea sputorum]|uniref:Osmotically-inducible protein Y n=1 Tax=Pandoraea sputorum TaxID=93222 RepID=A0A239SIX2_9BURK|nr:BON domain-containing protein [Pandoraea sputorum]AJC17153.1 OsmY domain-containing protein [Pandoraea sputorum]BET09865.1 BON domain-containing protein [Pandoraea sputorum]SNU85347.1 Osmotically-inducible protein Y precursor [Pandoraea sputorum]VVD84979.1 OsmY domain-containing protein [Pandoraea sputorum]
MKNDLQLKKDVEQELEWDPAINAADIGVQVHDGIVTLSGHLHSYAEKLATKRATQRVEGVRAVVVEMVVAVPNEHRRTDADIASTARTVLLWSAGLSERAVQVTVEKGCVTLTGEVDWGYQMLAAEKVVAHLRGVNTVFNDIRIKRRAAPTDITSKIESALRRHAEEDARHISVHVADGTVTLRGNVSSLDEKTMACNAAWSAPGVRHVIDEMSVGRP